MGRTMPSMPRLTKFYRLDGLGLDVIGHRGAWLPGSSIFFEDRKIQSSIKGPSIRGSVDGSRGSRPAIHLSDVSAVIGAVGAGQSESLLVGVGDS